MVIVREIVFEEHQTISVPNSFKRVDNVSIYRNTVEDQHVTKTDNLVVNQFIEPNVEILLRRSQWIKRPTLSDDYTLSMRVILILVKPLILTPSKQYHVQII